MTSDKQRLEELLAMGSDSDSDSDGPINSATTTHIEVEEEEEELELEEVVKEGKRSEGGEDEDGEEVENNEDALVVGNENNINIESSQNDFDMNSMSHSPQVDANLSTHRMDSTFGDSLNTRQSDSDYYQQQQQQQYQESQPQHYQNNMSSQLEFEDDDEDDSHNTFFQSKKNPNTAVTSTSIDSISDDITTNTASTFPTTVGLNVNKEQQNEYQQNETSATTSPVISIPSKDKTVLYETKPVWREMKLGELPDQIGFKYSFPYIPVRSFEVQVLLSFIP